MQDILIPNCQCGWRMPAQCAAFPFGAEPEPANQAVMHYVALVCPNCDRMHTFMAASAPLSGVEYERQKRKGSTKG